ncbi:pyridoxal kinase [Hyphomonas sp. WL0036]|uniref:pyridoxal kinase n=1 Tax=Hyphomonas sediminis TaxID=2866160 RepID=UPI001C80E760|nr:pyridoxal kinase [Hyphomonas sediminis]
MSVISIQSQVVFGHVGNSAAIYPMIANGVAVQAVPTTLLSNIPGYPTLRGRVLPADLVADLLLGVEERGLVTASRAMVTGYLGSVENAGAVKDFVLRAKKENPQLTYICDPVIGDTDLGVFVADGLPEFFRRELVPLADIITPNAFEFGLLAGLETYGATAVAGALRRGVGGLPDQLAVTGAIPEDAPGFIDTLIAQGGKIWRIRTPKVDVRPHGTGDLFTGALTASLARGQNFVAASEQAVASVYDVLASMPCGEAGEMPLAAQMAALRCQPRPFVAEPL